MSNVYKHERAKRDLEEIFVFLGERDLATGLDFLLAAEQTFDLLAQMPNLGVRRSFRAHRLLSLRQFPVKSYAEYLVFYQPVIGGVEIIRVLHGKRDLKAIFEGAR